MNNETLAGAFAKTGGLASVMYTALVAQEVLKSKIHWGQKLLWLLLLFIMQIVAALGFHFFEEKHGQKGSV